MDLSGFSRGKLQDFCRTHGLYAGGSHAELEARINEAITEGRDVEVYFPARMEWRDGFIERVLRQAKFEVFYFDNGKSCVHDLKDVVFNLKEAEAEDDGGEEEEEEEEEESEEEGDDLDLPATKGWGPGMRLEVEWKGKHGRRKISFWRPATLGRRAKRSTDSGGRQLYYMIYDTLPEFGFDEAEKTKVAFIPGEVLNDYDRGEIYMGWRHVEASDTEEDSSYTEGSEYDIADEYDIDDLTAGMAGLGSDELGGGRRPRKRALIVACSYPGSSAPLPGTLNDADEIRDLLVSHFAYPDTTDNFMILRDDTDNMLLQPTRRNIMKGFGWLLNELQSGDSLFLYFSGHGSTEDDPTGREWRGNQTICPCDYERARMITDTEIYEALVKPLPRNTTLHALIDSCHSGTVMNMPYNAVLHDGRFSDWDEEYPGESWKRGTAGGLAVQFSAARHDQYASEAPMGRGKRRAGRKRESQSRGAATYAFTQAILQHHGYWGSDILYSDLLEKMSYELKKSEFFDQDPQMSCTQQLDLDRPDVKLTI